MPQVLSEKMIREAAEVDIANETIPSLEGAQHYFSLVEYKGQKLLCILDDKGTWRPTSYNEMMGLM